MRYTRNDFQREARGADGADGKPRAWTRWGRPIVAGTYLATIEKAEEREDDHDDSRFLQVTFGIADQGPERTPDGGVRIDFPIKPGWRLAAICAVFAAGAEEQDEVDLDPGELEGCACKLVVGHWTGRDGRARAQVRRILAEDAPDPAGDEDEDEDEGAQDDGGGF